jgi:tryptophanyl-tRNA synthetase
LGNYFGTVLPNIAAHEKAGAGYIMIADLHALTSTQDAEALRSARKEMALDLLSCGFDAEKTVFFVQSGIAAHAELNWILSTVSPMGLLERAVSYKEKVEKGIAASVGLFTYPVLQTADIVLYDIDMVPVGKDQKQHLEMCRDIAMKFNNTFGDTFVVPEPKIQENVAVVPGTDGQKMSKSYGNTIPLFGTDAEWKKAVMGIVTDSKGPTEPKDPATCIVYQIHKLFLNESEAKALAKEYSDGLAYGEAKKKLLATIIEKIGPMREKREELAKDPEKLHQLMCDGTEKARQYAEKTMEKVRAATGLS